MRSVALPQPSGGTAVFLIVAPLGTQQLREERCLNSVMRYSIPQRNVNPWYGLKGEMIMAVCVRQMKEKMFLFDYLFILFLFSSRK